MIEVQVNVSCCIRPCWTVNVNRYRGLVDAVVGVDLVVLPVLVPLSCFIPFGNPSPLLISCLKFPPERGYGPGVNKLVLFADLCPLPLFPPGFVCHIFNLMGIFLRFIRDARASCSSW